MLSRGSNSNREDPPKLDPKDSITALGFALRLYTGGDPDTGIKKRRRAGGKHITKVYEALL